jgi:hypothetical protein
MLPERGLNRPLDFKITDLSVSLFHWQVSPLHGASSDCGCKRRSADKQISCKYRVIRILSAPDDYSTIVRSTETF